MTHSKLDLTALPPDSLFGTAGVLTYTSYRRVFSGQFDASGEPILCDASVRDTAVIVQRHEGQRFEGVWMPQAPPPCVVLDTGHLTLAFECPDPLSHPMGCDRFPRLRIEAVVLGRLGGQRSTAWRIFQYPGASGEPGRVLWPPLNSPFALAPSNTGSRHVTFADAVAFLREEKSWVQQQRRALVPQPGADLNPASAREMACLDILGKEYSRAVQQHGLLEPRLRRSVVGPQDPPPVPGQRPPISPTDSLGQLELHESLGRRMASLAQHPKLEPLIADRTAWLLARDRALRRRLDHLDRLQASICGQAARAGLNLAVLVEPPMSAVEERSALKPKLLNSSPRLMM